MISINLNSFVTEKQNMPDLCHVSANNGDPKWIHPLHRHLHHHEVVFVRGGNGHVIVDNMPYDVKKYDLLVYPCGVLHHELSSESNPLQTHIFGVRTNSNENSIFRQNFSPVFSSCPYEAALQSLFSTLFDECSAQNEGFRITAAYLAQCILSYIERLVSFDQEVILQKIDDSLEDKIKQYLDEYYRQPLTLASLAQHFHISTYYLSHIFKHATGFSPISYIINRRLGEAEYLLLTTSASVSSIASQVGYEDVNYFSIVFKKMIGVSPGHFRKISTKR